MARRNQSFPYEPGLSKNLSFRQSHLRQSAGSMVTTNILKLRDQYQDTETRERCLVRQTTTVVGALFPVRYVINSTIFGPVMILYKRVYLSVGA